MNRQELKRLQQVELDILKEFIKICEEEKLRYFAIGGTVLGAVRHGGFIPWDDDVDVGMPRSDYEKFLKIAQDKLPKHMFLQYFATDLEVPYHFAKIRNSNTTFVELSCAKIKMNHGVYIDIFPLDGYPDSKIKKKFVRSRKVLFDIYMGRIFYGSKANLKVRIISRFLMLLMPNYKKQIIKNEKFYKSFDYDKSDNVISYYSGYGLKAMYPKEYFGEGVECDFEGIKIKVPAKTEEYLTRLYGDYMQLPPEEKRYGHHHTFALDLERSYIDVLKNNKQGDI